MMGKDQLLMRRTNTSDIPTDAVFEVEVSNRVSIELNTDTAAQDAAVCFCSW